MKPNTRNPNETNPKESDKTGFESLVRERPTESNAIQIPEISLPKGGGALKGIDEKFEVNAANGTAGFSIPLPITPGRNGFSPSLAVSYNSGGGNGPFGLGWSVGLPSIQRKTDKRLPRYKDGLEEDIFMFSGAEDLVPFLEEMTAGEWIPKEYEDETGAYQVKRYRPRIEGGFARIEKIAHADHGTYWKVTTRDNVVTIFGRKENTRIADPADPSRIFQWLPEFSYDDKGNWLQYEYKTEDLDRVPSKVYEKNRLNGLAPFTNKYLKYIKYGYRKPYYADPSKPYDPQIPLNEEYFFEVVFDYGEHHPNIPVPEIASSDPKWDYRPDPFSSYRSGFEIRTNRICKRVLMFHHFKDEKQLLGYEANGTKIETPFGENYLVRSLDLTYEPSSINGSELSEVTYLSSITQTGYIRKEDGTYSKKSLPPMEFTYQNLNWNKQIRVVDQESIANAPVGLTNNYQWVDLYGEGISGILTEQGQGWYYKSNYGDVDEDGQITFTRAQKVAPRPSFGGFNTGVLSLQDLESNGQKQIVVNTGTVKGYFELDVDENWKSFQPFEQMANINLQDPNTRLLDLTGDGQPDILMTEQDVFTWYAADGKKGHKPAERLAKMLNEEVGPRIVFSDPKQTIFLADMSGDGLTDIARIRNGSICYWANKGYGRFSAKITMENTPWFDHPDHFNPQYLHLADVSGTGATDIIYLGKDAFKAYINLSGNAWSDAHEIDPFLPIDRNAKLSVIDLLGTGTSCIVWSSDLPTFAEKPMRYIDLMDSKKPHVLTHYKNNLGKETSIKYKSSTHFYLKDKLEGKTWITKLPFPVQVVSKTVVEEKITNVRFSSEYRYHHGYYDHPEREFRGFGMVEQLDTELYEEWKVNNDSNALDASEALYQAPTLVKTWFHTGAFQDKERILNQFKDEYWIKEYNRKFPDDPVIIPEYELPDATIVPALNIVDEDILQKLTADEWREAFRACKGMMLRQEVFTLDGPGEEPLMEDMEATAKYKKQLKPYTVATQNCLIHLIQPRQNNYYASFIVTESEALSIHYERNEEEPRIAHSLNVKIDDLGNVLESASVVYGKINTPDIDQIILDATDLDYQRDREKDTYINSLQYLKEEQGKTHIIYSRNRYTNDVIRNSAYRLRLPAETENYEIIGLTTEGPEVPFQVDDFTDILSTDSQSIDYHESPSSDNNIVRRKIEHIRTIFNKDDLSGPLDLYLLESSGIPYESYQLAFSEGLFEDIYDDKIEFNDANMQAGGFVQSEGDNHWWIRSGYVQYFSNDSEDINTARQRFYSPLAFIDPLGSTTKVNYYKGYFLFIEETEDALSNRMKVEQFNFRTLGPQVSRDLNENLSAIIQDELGIVKAVAILGKYLVDANGNVVELDLTDSLAGLQAITEEEEEANIQSFFATEDSIELASTGAHLLKYATSRFVYDFATYQNTGKPVVVAGINRETHHHHLIEDQSTKLQIGFEYSDGMGNVVMAKLQAEPEAEAPFSLRWIGNGRTILNNKGNPVKQYEPYFSITPHFEDAPELVETGVTPIIYYDALGRNIKTELPDGTFTKVAFDPWKQIIYDQNDTVMDSQWYTDRMNPDGSLFSDESSQAAQKASKHHNTPTHLHLDSLGRPVLSIVHNKIEEKDEYYSTIIELDIEGNTRAVIDARGNTVMAYKYDMLGHRLYQNSMDAGERWMLYNVMGNPVKSWDSRNHIFSYFYDVLQRPSESKVEGGDGAPLNNIFAKVIYGENQPNEKLLNLRGQAIAQYDTAGKVAIESYDIKGAPLKSSRQFAVKYKETVNWNGDVDALLETDIYTTELKYDALGRVIWSKTPDGSVTEPGYNEAGLLDTVKVTQNGSSQLFVKGINYNEKGQRENITYGNDVQTAYTYDKETFRLINLESKKGNQSILQNLLYTYDPVGNISEIEDQAIPTTFFGNYAMEAKSEYSYNPLYQLTEAKGREHIAQVDFTPKDNWNDLPFLKQYNPNDAMAMRSYTQRYAYDAVGNILSVEHLAPINNGSWYRSYQYESDNNRLLSTRRGRELENLSQSYTYFHHSAHGFITTMPHLSVMAWNFLDELKAVAQQVITNGTPETTYYVYDGSGQRVRKITENQATGSNTPTKKEERLYLAGVEIYRKYTGSNSGLERTTLHVMDDTRRIAMMDTRNEINDGTDLTTIRYQLSNHLESACLEVNEQAAIISYEEYHPYGTTAYQAVNASIKATGKRYRYTGMERDEESGFNYHGARYYLSWLGRWLKPDPLGIEGGICLYCYSSNNPIRIIDRTGFTGEDVENSKWGFVENLEELTKKFKENDIELDQVLWASISEGGVSPQYVYGLVKNNVGKITAYAIEVSQKTIEEFLKYAESIVEFLDPYFKTADSLKKGALLPIVIGLRFNKSINEQKIISTLSNLFQDYGGEKGAAIDAAKKIYSNLESFFPKDILFKNWTEFKDKLSFKIGKKPKESTSPSNAGKSNLESPEARVQTETRKNVTQNNNVYKSKKDVPYVKEKEIVPEAKKVIENTKSSKLNKILKWFDDIAENKWVKRLGKVIDVASIILDVKDFLIASFDEKTSIGEYITRGAKLFVNFAKNIAKSGFWAYIALEAVDYGLGKLIEYMGY